MARESENRGSYDYNTDATKVTMVTSAGAAASYGGSNADGLAVNASSVFQRTGSFNYVFNGTTWDRVKKPNAASRIPSSANTTNATVAKASAGDVFRVSGFNDNAAVRYLKLYNKATAPTVGTDTPLVTLALPPDAVFDYDLSGMYFSTGISFALTTGAADADTGAVASADILGLNIVYQ